MRLRAKTVPYSSIVGGGLMLTDTITGEARFIVTVRGVSGGITRRETEIISKALAIGFQGDDGVEVPDR